MTSLMYLLGGNIAGDFMKTLGEVFFIIACVSLFVGVRTMFSNKQSSGDSRKDQHAGADATSSDLFGALARSGVSYHLDDVIMIVRSVDGKLMWLEKGDELSGFMHIRDRYNALLASKGVYDIPGFLQMILQTMPTSTGNESDEPFADYLVNGTCYRVVSRPDGYIASFYLNPDLRS